MMMTESEICASYRNAKSSRSQIGILADLNAVDKSVIEKILKDHGVYNSKRGPKPKAAVINKDFEEAVDKMVEEGEKKKEKKPEELPEIMRQAIEMSIDFIDMKIAEDEKALEDIKKSLEGLKVKKVAILEWLGKTYPDNDGNICYNSKTGQKVIIEDEILAKVHALTAAS